jgi:hypothetical protein
MPKKQFVRSGARNSIYDALAGGVGSQSEYPKITVKLKYKVYLTKDVDFEFEPDAQLAALSVLHRAGLEGEYEWLSLVGKDLKEVKKGAFEAVKKANLTSPLRLPAGFYDLKLVSNSNDLRRGKQWIQVFPRLKVTFTSVNGKSAIHFDQPFTAPIGGARVVDEVLTIELPLFTPYP